MTSKVVSQPMDANHPFWAPANRSHPLQALDHLAITTSYSRGQEICGQSRPADNWYLVVAGSARRYVARPDGRRQIVDLLLPGNFFGCTARDEYDFTVEAISVGTTITNYPRRRVETLADSDPRLAREIRMLVLEAMSRLQSQLLIVGRVTAPEKVGSFLLDMAARLSPGRPDNVMLPVSRYDIADYLAVSVETVSRSLTDLKHRGVIAFSSGTRSVRIVDRDALDDGEASRAHDAPGRSNTAWRRPLVA